MTGLLELSPEEVSELAAVIAQELETQGHIEKLALVLVDQIFEELEKGLAERGLGILRQPRQHRR